MKIEILGTGCSKCKKLYENTLSAVKAAGVTAEVLKVEDIEKIIGYGVMSTPALVIDGEVKTAGTLPNVEEIQNIIKG